MQSPVSSTKCYGPGTNEEAAHPRTETGRRSKPQLQISIYKDLKRRSPFYRYQIRKHVLSTIPLPLPPPHPLKPWQQSPRRGTTATAVLDPHAMGTGAPLEGPAPLTQPSPSILTPVPHLTGEPRNLHNSKVFLTIPADSETSCLLLPFME